MSIEIEGDVLGGGVGVAWVSGLCDGTHSAFGIRVDGVTRVLEMKITCDVRSSGRRIYLIY